MLRIYPVSIEMVRRVAVLASQVERFDKDHARQIRRASMSVVLNVAEGSGSRGGTRRARYETALGSARETLAGLDASEAVGYTGPVDVELRRTFHQIIGTLVKLVRATP